MKYLEIPHASISFEALEALLEEAATRGGFEDNSGLSQRKAQIRKKLDQGLVKIVFNLEEESVNLVEASLLSQLDEDVSEAD